VVELEPVFLRRRAVGVQVERGIERFVADDRALGLQDTPHLAEDRDRLLHMLEEPAEEGAVESVLFERQMERVPDTEARALAVRIAAKVLFRARDLLLGRVDAGDLQLRKALEQDASLGADPAADLDEALRVREVHVAVNDRLEQPSLKREPVLLLARET